MAGSSIGNATIGSNSAILGTNVDKNASFFAQSYTWNGQTVIAYRGTDAFGGDARRDGRAKLAVFA